MIASISSADEVAAATEALLEIKRQAASKKKALKQAKTACKAAEKALKQARKESRKASKLERQSLKRHEKLHGHIKKSKAHSGSKPAKSIPDKVLEEVKGTGGTILQTSLTHEDEAKLHAALARRNSSPHDLFHAGDQGLCRDPRSAQWLAHARSPSKQIHSCKPSARRESCWREWKCAAGRLKVTLGNLYQSLASPISNPRAGSGRHRAGTVRFTAARKQT